MLECMYAIINRISGPAMLRTIKGRNIFYFLHCINGFLVYDVAVKHKGRSSKPVILQGHM